jgi:hypothetical protein
VQPIRVVVADLTGILSDIIIETLEHPPDLSVAVVAPGGSAVLLADASEADVAILGGAREGLPPLGQELLRRRPWMNILTIHGDGREAFLHQLRPVERALGEISPQTLLDAVRAVASERS